MDKKFLIQSLPNELILLCYQEAVNARANGMYSKAKLSHIHYDNMANIKNQDIIKLIINDNFEQIYNAQISEINQKFRRKILDLPLESQTESVIKDLESLENQRRDAIADWENFRLIEKRFCDNLEYCYKDEITIFNAGYPIIKPINFADDKITEVAVVTKDNLAIIPCPFDSHNHYYSKESIYYTINDKYTFDKLFEKNESQK